MRLCSFLGMAALVATTMSLQAGTPSQTSPAQTPTYRSTTRAVVVDVVVAKGNNAVVGLHKQDFQVFEDGKPQAVDFFEEHSARALPAGAIAPLPKMPPGVYTNVPRAPENDSVNVLLLDTLNTDKQDQSYVRQEILTFLQKMQPGIRVAVFVLGAKLRMVQGFTTDSAALRNAVTDQKNGVSPESETSVTRSLQDKVDDFEDKQRMTALWMSPTGLDVLSALQDSVTGYKADQRAGMTLEALKAMALYLASVPGRKNLIWFSTSFPITVFPSPQEKQAMFQSRQYTAAVKETADLLTVSKVAVYPIGAEGMMVSHVCDPVINTRQCYDVEGGEVSSRSGPAGPARAGDAITPWTNENAARSDKIMAMEQLAADTGGRAFYNTNDLNAAMQKAIADGAHYYTLVYTPTNKKMDGSYRRIEVKVPEGKYRLAYRHGYNADDAAHLVTTAAESTPLHGLMMHGMPDATQLLYAVHVVAENPQPAANSPHAGKNAKLTGPTRRYSIDFMIRWTDVKLDAASDGSHTGKIQIELRAYDRAGNAVNWTGGTQAMSLKPDLFAAIQKSGVPAHVEIDLPSDQDIYLETGVYDWQTGKAGTLEIPLPKEKALAVASARSHQTK